MSTNKPTPKPAPAPSAVQAPVPTAAPVPEKETTAAAAPVTKAPDADQAAPSTTEQAAPALQQSAEASGDSPKAENELEASLKEVIDGAGEIGAVSGNTQIDLQQLASTGPVGEMVAEAAVLLNEEDENTKEMDDPVHVESDPQPLLFWKNDIQTYLDQMRPGVPQYDNVAAATKQRRFGLRLLNAAAILGDHYKAGMDYLLQVILDNSGEHQTFHDNYIFRFFDEPTMRRSKDDREKIINFISFLKLMAEPSSRQIMKKQVDMKLILSALPDDAARRQLQNYFGSK